MKKNVNTLKQSLQWGKKLYWSPNVCFPWQLRVFWDLNFGRSLLYLDRKLLLMFLVWERPRWSVWEAQHWAEVSLSSEVLLYFSTKLCPTSTVFITLSWMKVQTFPFFSNSVQRCKPLCLITIHHSYHTHISRSADALIQQKRNIWRWELHLWFWFH